VPRDGVDARVKDPSTSRDSSAGDSRAEIAPTSRAARRRARAHDDATAERATRRRSIDGALERRRARPRDASETHSATTTHRRLTKIASIDGGTTNDAAVFARERGARGEKRGARASARATRESTRRERANGRGEDGGGGVSTRAVGTRAGEVRDDGDAGRETRRWTRD
jgi:hypothetical protein